MVETPLRGTRLDDLTPLFQQPAPALPDNEPFGSRPEPGAYRLAPILQLLSGEVPEGKAGVRIQARGSCA
jgi:hypothetical protein